MRVNTDAKIQAVLSISRHFDGAPVLICADGIFVDLEHGGLTPLREAQAVWQNRRLEMASDAEIPYGRSPLARLLPQVLDHLNDRLHRPL